MKIMRGVISSILAFILITGCTGSNEANPNSEKPQTEESSSEQTGEKLEITTEFTGEEPIKPYFPAKNIGSAKELVGDILFVSIFIDDPESKITTQLEEEMLSELNKAGEWLEEEAKKRGKEARITTGKENAELILKYDHPNVITAERGMPYEDMMFIMKEMKTGSYYKRISQKYNTENIAFVLHLNKNGRSNACSSNLQTYSEFLLSDDTVDVYEADYGYFDVCLVYSMMYWEPLNYVVYAHELLHLFGADDLYYSDHYEDERGENAVNMYMEKEALINKYFLNEIMNSTSPPIEICDLTAYLIGWEETVPAKYAYFLYEP